MRVKMVLPALTEATSPLFRPVKYSLFPPLGLATLAGYLNDDDEVTVEDEHVEKVRLDDEPDVVVIQVYITSARRAYELADHYRARGAYVCLGGLHPTSLPDEAAAHADTVFIGPGEDTWPAFLADYRAGRPAPLYRSTTRTLEGLPPIRRDLIKRHLYLVPNSIVISRGCPHVCDFCYKEAFFEGGKGFYTQSVDAALAEIERLPGRHLYFLDDHLFGNARFATGLFDGMRGMNRLFQGAATVQAVLRPGMVEAAAAAGLRSLFVGFETLSDTNLLDQHKKQNLGRDYGQAIRRLHDNGVMVNGSFVFGMDDDRPDVFERTVEWAVAQGIETATFHILTPYPGTALFRRMQEAGRIVTTDWDRYDTRSVVFERTVEWAVAQGIETATFHILTPYPGTALFRRMQEAGRIVTTDWDRYDTRSVVFRPTHLTPQQLEDGYWRAYRDFYTWKNIAKGAATKPNLRSAVRHAAYSGGWKRFESMWDAAIRAKRIAALRPVLEGVLRATPQHGGRPQGSQPTGSSALVTSG